MTPFRIALISRMKHRFTDLHVVVFVHQAWRDEAERLGRALASEEQWDVGIAKVAALGDPASAEK